MADYHTLKTYKAAYHPIKDSDEWPIANLILLLSHRGHPLRAELHLNSDAPVPEGSSSLEAYALDAARKYVSENYATNDENAQKMEVRLYHVDQRHPTEHIDLNYIKGATQDESALGPWLVAAAIAIMMIVIGVVWGFATLFNRAAVDTISADERALVDVIDLSGAAANEEAAQGVAGAGLDTDSAIENASDAVSGAQEGVSNSPPNSTNVDPTVAETNGLPPSSNANSNLQVGLRVRVVPGSALTLRTEPGVDSGQAIGFMENAQEATIVGGPHWLQGLSDTIVWWYLRLDDGTEAWAPANDSNFTLLENAPRG